MLTIRGLILGGLAPLFLAATAPGGYFTAGDLVVVQIGTGAAALTSAATQTNLTEFTTTGQKVQAIALPTTTTGANLALTNSGTATSEGALALSADGHYLTLAGYDATVGTASVASTATTAVPRVIGLVSASGTINTTTQITDGYSGNNVRGAVTTNGQTLYAAGASGSTGGTRETSLGGSGASTQISTNVTNTRAVAIFNGQLYASSSSGSNVGINAIGTGVPTTGGQTTTLITSGTPSAATSPDAFVFLGNNLYVADDGYGLLKYTFSTIDGKYDYVSTLSTIKGLSGLTGVVGATGDELLYATDPTNLILFDDNNLGTATATTLATAATNTAFRGIAFAPTPAVATAVPEPASVALLGLGLVAGAGLAARRRSLGALVHRLQRSAA